MKAVIPKILFICAVLAAQAAQREAVYAGAVSVGGQAVPLFANGYLVYLHRPNRLQVFRPDTQLAYEYDVPCPPQTSDCSVAGAGISKKGVAALGIGYLTGNGYAAGIRLLDDAGKEIRFIDTARYVPRQLVFDTQRRSLGNRMGTGPMDQ